MDGLIKNKLETLEEALINNESFNSDEWFGFIYLIEDTTNGKRYIGKKNFKSQINKKLGKKEIAALPVTRGRTPSKKKVISESDWKTYYSSNDIIKNDSDKTKYKRYLLKLCKSKTALSYFEVKYQMIYEILEYPELWYNNNISGTYFSKNIL